jgi:hypothetical protein
MSALLPKADIAGLQFDVRFVPSAEISVGLLDYIVRNGENA